MQIQVERILNVEAVERQLAELWKQTSGEVGPEDDFAVLRSRVANLLVCVARESSLTEVKGIVAELTAMHPSRVLLLLAEANNPDSDIDISIETFCQTEKRTGAKRLSCEEVTLKASGSFVNELPSAALPLLVPDLTTFLWWQDALISEKGHLDDVFDALLRASDRLIVDSAEFVHPYDDLVASTGLFNNQDYTHVGISDLNWARLTSWRALLAGFYDVPNYQTQLYAVDEVRIDYIAIEHSPDAIEDVSDTGIAVAPQALLMAGWLASRLGWSLSEDQQFHGNGQTTTFRFFSAAGGSSAAVREGSNSSDHYIKLKLNRVEHAQGKPGRLVQVQLQSNSGQPASFTVARSDDNLHLTTEARIIDGVHRGRVVPVRNRSAAQLLGREMEILCNDQIYQEALAVAARMIDRSRTHSG